MRNLAAPIEKYERIHSNAYTCPTQQLRGSRCRKHILPGTYKLFGPLAAAPNEKRYVCWSQPLQEMRASHPAHCCRPAGVCPASTRQHQQLLRPLAAAWQQAVLACPGPLPAAPGSAAAAAAATLRRACCRQITGLPSSGTH